MGESLTQRRRVRDDVEVLTKTGVNWSDVNVMTLASVNWDDIEVLTKAGLNWDDVNVLTRTGINWSDINVMSGAGVNWSDVEVLSKAGVNWDDVNVLTRTGVNWSDVNVLSNAGVNWDDVDGYGLGAHSRILQGEVPRRAAGVGRAAVRADPGPALELISVQYLRQCLLQVRPPDDGEGQVRPEEQYDVPVREIVPR